VTVVRQARDGPWIVRLEALDALSQAGDPSVLANIDPKMDDENNLKYTAAAAVIHLNDVLARRHE